MAEVRVERRIPAPPAEVFDAWLDPRVPGSPWHQHERLIVDTRVDGLWYWRSLGGTPHYGRFIAIDRPARVEHSWMSPNTLGQESLVTVRFGKEGDGTLLTLLHSGLPSDAMAGAHEKGWNAILDRLGHIFDHASPRGQ
jgi:uncharacterized protein YndB with AHSA1/START domain